MRTYPHGVPSWVDTEQPDTEAAIAPPGHEQPVAWNTYVAVDGVDETAGAVAAAGEAPDHWHVTFSVADRDDAVATAERLGATMLSSEEPPGPSTPPSADPQGAELTLSQFTPPG